MTSDQRSAPGTDSGTGGLPNPCPCCHGLEWIDTDTHYVCPNPDAHTRQPRHELAGITAYECPHCTDDEPTLELPIPTPDQARTIIDYCRQIVAPIYHRGVHRAVLRELRASHALEVAFRSRKEQTDATP